jgi:hypothetical protein
VRDISDKNSSDLHGVHCSEIYVVESSLHFGAPLSLSLFLPLPPLIFGDEWISRPNLNIVLGQLKLLSGVIVVSSNLSQTHNSQNLTEHHISLGERCANVSYRKGGERKKKEWIL